jgi:hypothetical protein
MIWRASLRAIFMRYDCAARRSHSGPVLSAPTAMFRAMNSTILLIIVTGAGPVAGALLAPGFTNALLALARARGQKVEHVSASGTDLYNNGVPLTEVQFREAFAAMQADLDRLSPPAERNQWELRQQYAAIDRFSVLAATYPQAFPIRSSADDAWDWYQANNPYATRDLPSRHGFQLQPPSEISVTT